MAVARRVQSVRSMTSRPSFANDFDQMGDRRESVEVPSIDVNGLGQVRLVGLLGEGGMAQVYLGHHERLGRPVAVKRLRRQLANVAEAQARLRAEANIARALRHDHIVDVFDLVTDPAGDTYLIMEHLAGEPLSARLARSGALPLSETLTIAVQISDAVAAVHRRGIVHRDLKTENVLVGVDAHGATLAKLIDFGVAEILGGPDGTIEPPSVIGTPESMSPEQALAAPLDQRSDIYSFGVLLYEMVTGGPPFLCENLEKLLLRVVNEAPVAPSKTPGAQKHLIPDALERLILKCLAKRPENRPQSIELVLAELRRIAADYRALSDALDHAMTEVAEIDPAATRTLTGTPMVMAPPALDTPLPAAMPVRAVGTAGDGRAATAPVIPPVAIAAGPAWSGDFLIDSEPAPAIRRASARPATSARPAISARPATSARPAVARDLAASVAPVRAARRSGRLGRIARTTVLLAAVAAGAGGATAYVARSPELGFSFDLGDWELPWQR
jgi:tRNA A-37 threonylcarbamoyl transferase component Bud32